MARASLKGPKCPDEARYLVEWAWTLHGRSGWVEGAVLPLSYTTVEAWARMLDLEVEPHEVEALLQLDAAIRSPEEPKDEAKPERPMRPKGSRWPKPKPQGATDG